MRAMSCWNSHALLQREEGSVQITFPKQSLLGDGVFVFLQYAGDLIRPVADVVVSHCNKLRIDGQSSDIRLIGHSAIRTGY